MTQPFDINDSWRYRVSMAMTIYSESQPRCQAAGIHKSLQKRRLPTRDGQPHSSRVEAEWEKCIYFQDRVSI